MVRSVIQNSQKEVPPSSSDLTSPDRVRYFLDGFISPVRFVVDEFDVLNADHVVVMSNGIVDEVLGILGKDRPSASLPFQHVILQSWLR